jgi:hypothetical protein
MISNCTEIHGIRAIKVAPEGPVLNTERDVVELIGDALGYQTDTVLLPISRLGEAFFDLSSLVAGSVVQKFVNYRQRLVIVGDIQPWLANSQSLRDFVRECNCGQQIWFVPTMEEATSRLEARIR